MEFVGYVVERLKLFSDISYQHYFLELIMSQQICSSTKFVRLEVTLRSGQFVVIF
jgi:hypothetical protein